METRDAYNLIAMEDAAYHGLPDWDSLSIAQQESLSRDWEVSLDYALDDFLYHAKRIVK